MQWFSRYNSEPDMYGIAISIGPAFACLLTNLEHLDFLLVYSSSQSSFAVFDITYCITYGFLAYLSS